MVEGYDNKDKKKAITIILFLSINIYTQMIQYMKVKATKSY